MFSIATYSGWNNLCELFLDNAARMPEKPCLWRRVNAHWQPLTWREVEVEISCIAGGLQSLGIGAGDRVVIVSENRPEWLIAELAILSLGAIAVPAYTTNAEDDHLYILNNSDARLVVVSSLKLAKLVLAAAQRSIRCRTMIAMHPGISDGESVKVRCMSWTAVRTLGENRSIDLRALVAHLHRNDLAVIFHTSGTGGTPRGVMLTHGSVISNCMGGYDRLQAHIDYSKDVFLSFLPLSHAYEHATGQFTALSIGAQIYYCERVETLQSDMQSVHPTIMTVVPRVLETLHSRVYRAIRKKGRLHQKLFDEAVRIGKKRYQAQRSLNVVERLFDISVGHLVRTRVASMLGGKLKFFVSGGAPLNYEIALFFVAVGIRLIQGYGQTEAGPVITCNPTLGYKIDSVGPPLRGVDLDVAGDGEIRVRGELVMQGYSGDATATDSVLRDGWLHTGDIGYLDPDGHLHITDRKKDIIVNSGGENIAPQRVEGYLTLQPEIAQAMVYGDRRPHIVALLVPDTSFLADWCRENSRHLSLAEAATDVQFQNAMGEVVHRINRHLTGPERIRSFALADHPFTIENGMLTPSMKIRRHKILTMFSPVLNELYG